MIKWKNDKTGKNICNPNSKLYIYSILYKIKLCEQDQKKR